MVEMNTDFAINATPDPLAFAVLCLLSVFGLTQIPDLKNQVENPTSETCCNPIMQHFIKITVCASVITYNTIQRQHCDGAGLHANSRVSQISHICANFGVSRKQKTSGEPIQAHWNGFLEGTVNRYHLSA